ncbi:hypothetical protein SCALM49S_07759 [Streptomyces californicus]
MTDTLDEPQTLADGAEDAPAYPVKRTCPYRMPPGYEELREKGPISRVTLWNGRTAWLVTGNDLGRRLFPDARLSSDVLDPRFPLLAPRIEAQRQQAAAPPLVGVDDPVHARQRRMVLPSFGIRQINALRPEIQKYADGLLDTMLAKGPGVTVDLLTEYALPMPSAVICPCYGGRGHGRRSRGLRHAVRPGQPDGRRRGDPGRRRPAAPGAGLLDQGRPALPGRRREPPPRAGAGVERRTRRGVPRPQPPPRLRGGQLLDHVRRQGVSVRTGARRVRTDRGPGARGRFEFRSTGRCHDPRRATNRERGSL